jgi:nucleotide-binding universal stress UspA family protein
MDVHSSVLCPTDFSDPARAGLDMAVVVAERIGAEILLVHVVSSVPVAAIPRLSPAMDVEGYQKELAKSAKQGLKELVRDNVPGTIETRSIVSTGNPAGEICRIAGEENVSMIVMATHGQSGWKRLLVGSVAEKVVRCSPCPVLTVPQPDPSRGDDTTLVRDWGLQTRSSEL